MSYLILEYNDFNDVNDLSTYKNRSNTRVKSLSEEEFLEVLKNNCKNFSLNNDQLWRGNSDREFGQQGIFFESRRAGVIGKYNYHNFFDDRKDYIVPRYKSLIGSTSIRGAGLFGSSIGASDAKTLPEEDIINKSQIYRLIPFDNANIIFASAPDLAIWSRLGQQTYSDDMFLLKEYTEDFKSPIKELKEIALKNVMSKKMSIIDTFGFELFTNSKCLLISGSKTEWLRTNLS